MYVGEGCSYYNSIVILVSENDKNVIVHLVKNSVGKNMYLLFQTRFSESGFLWLKEQIIKI